SRGHQRGVVSVSLSVSICAPPRRHMAPRIVSSCERDLLLPLTAWTHTHTHTRPHTGFSSCASQPHTHTRSHTELFCVSEHTHTHTHTRAHTHTGLLCLAAQTHTHTHSLTAEL